MYIEAEQPGRLNIFALVAYIPGPLGSFLNHLRRELIPSCALQTHVTILPPRPLFTGASVAEEQVCCRIRDVSAFPVELADVEVFSSTSVVYLSLGTGTDELRCMHRVLNTGILGFEEPYEYHPHITLAQELGGRDVEEAAEFARRRWAECRHPRGFLVDTVSFVQNTEDNLWVDLSECQLGKGSFRPVNQVAHR